MSTLAAAALHGIAFAVTAAVLDRTPTARPALPAVEVEVIAAKPDPVLDLAPRVPPVLFERVAPSFSKPTRRRQKQTPELSPSSDAPDLATPVVAEAATAPAVPPAPSATVPSMRAPPRQIASPAGGTVVSATPRYRSNPLPDYPLASKRRHEEGVVYLNVVVRPNGLPAAISLNRSCGHPLLDRAAIDAVHGWTFEPARAAGVPVSSLIVVPVHFSLSDGP